MHRRTCALLLFLAALCHAAALPTPKQHLGFTPGDDYKLADYAQITGYFQKLDAASDRITLVEFGKSTLGKPMYVAFISDAENLKHLDRYRDISRRLALGQATAEEARSLAAEGKAIVWIDSGLHASEVAPAQHAPELAFRMVTGDDPETRAIRRDVILMQVPVMNPDGLDWVAHWYAKNVGTPYELAPLPWLYQKYSGHDNNRDYFMLNLPETRATTRLLFHEWFPQIVYNQHQTPPFPARIFMPPYAEPLNPNVPAPVMAGINLIGAAMRERFARENKPGVLSYVGFDGWWNGGLRSVPAFHNMHGILTETALNMYATPRVYKESEIRGSFANGVPVREPSIFYDRPWMGGKWGLRDAIEYMLTADFAILNTASTMRQEYLLKAWQLARASITAGENGTPYAYVIAPEQWDRSAAPEMLERLALAGIEVKRARAAFRAGGKGYPAGTLLMLAGQPFRPYLVDLLEPQKYPEIRSGGAVKRPYDIAGWTLSMQMGVKVDRIDERFDVNLERWSGRERQAPSLDRRDTHSFLAMAAMLERGEKVEWAADGAINSRAKAAWEVRRPRVGLYEPWLANADQGWTEWVLERFKVPFTKLHNPDLQKAGLRARFDSVILASQGAASILHGIRHGENRTGAPAVQRPEYTGGIGLKGLSALDAFVREGGTLIALDSATELPIDFFPLPVRNLQRGGVPDSEARFSCPGSLVRITVDPSHPLAFGMPPEAIAFTNGGQAYDLTLDAEHNRGDQEVRTVARFAATNLLASGWMSGEKAVLGKAVLVEAKHGLGRVVLFGIRPQFRAQPYGTFRLLLNAVYLASAKAL
ncbi:MAG TPA: M14 metallopeptidase family protein [Bryobacteraceae bacterium]|nr:M14 metallopeptidase family protein [Bryobacteraceae bacterium]